MRVGFGSLVAAGCVIVLTSAPAVAQVDLSGEWTPVRAEDNVGNPELGGNLEPRSHSVLVGLLQTP